MTSVASENGKKVMTMAEYIEREVLLEAFDHADADVLEDYGDGTSRWGFGIENILKVINSIPAADVAPVRHGRWEQTKEWATKAKYRCSVCGREIMSSVKVNIEKYPYCHCGAKMEGE